MAGALTVGAPALLLGPILHSGSSLSARLPDREGLDPVKKIIFEDYWSLMIKHSVCSPPLHCQHNVKLLSMQCEQ